MRLHSSASSERMVSRSMRHESKTCILSRERPRKWDALSGPIRGVPHESSYLHVHDDIQNFYSEDGKGMITRQIRNLIVNRNKLRILPILFRSAVTSNSKATVKAAITDLIVTDADMKPR